MLMTERNKNRCGYLTCGHGCCDGTKVKGRKDKTAKRRMRRVEKRKAFTE